MPVTGTGDCSHQLTAIFFGKSIANHCAANNVCSGSPEGYNPLTVNFSLPEADFTEYAGCSGVANATKVGYWTSDDTSGVYTINIDQNGNCLDTIPMV